MIGIGGESFAENEAHQIVRAQRKIARLHGWRNLVIGLRYEVFDSAGFRTIAIGLERVNACQPIRIASLEEWTSQRLVLLVVEELLLDIRPKFRQDIGQGRSDQAGPQLPW